MYLYVLENSLPNVFVNGSVEYSIPHEIGNIFITIFTSLSSTSLTSEGESDLEIDKTFSLHKNKGLINIKTNKFNFVHTTNVIVEMLINNLDSTSGPGLSEIPSVFIKVSNNFSINFKRII